MLSPYCHCSFPFFLSLGKLLQRDTKEAISATCVFFSLDECVELCVLCCVQPALLPAACPVGHVTARLVMGSFSITLILFAK